MPLKFGGTPHYDEASLIRVLQASPNAPLTQKFMQAARTKLTEFYLDRGFPDLRIRISEPSDGSLLFHIESGKQWFIGIKGLRATTHSHYQDLWAKFLGQGTNRDVSNLKSQLTNRLLELGFPNANVQITEFQPNAHARLVEIEIDEKESVQIESVSWKGASAFDEKRLQQELEAELVAALETQAPWKGLDGFQRRLVHGSSPNQEFKVQQEGLGRLPSPSKRWVPVLYTKALRRIESLYRDRGYFEAQIKTPQISGEGSFRSVEIHLEEGNITHYQELAIEGNKAFSQAALALYLETMFQIAPDRPVRLSMLEEARIGLIRRYRDQGFLYARVEFELLAAENNQAILRIDVDENTPVTLGRIYVRGHEHTSEEFIRNRITLKPDAPYFLNQALEDQRRLSELDIFSRVRLRLVNEEEPEPVKDLIAEVSERKRTKLQLSGGISTEDGPRL